MNILSEKLIKRFEPVEPMTFYREIFPAGELDEWGANTKGKYAAIAVEILKQPHDKQLIKRYTVTDDLDTIWLPQMNFLVTYLSENPHENWLLAEIARICVNNG